MDQIIDMTLIYGVLAVLALLIVVGYCLFVKEKEKWILFICVAIFVINTGYFGLSISRTLEGALMANRLAYFGSVFLPLCMLVIIMEVCQIKYQRIFLSFLIAVSVLVFLLAASGGYLTLYYKEVSIEFINGAARLVKTYGPLHKVYYVYLFTYFGGMVSVILYSAKTHGTSRKLAVFLASVVLGNVGIWLIEQLIHIDFEFLSISYVITELLLILLYGILEEEKILMTQIQEGEVGEEKHEVYKEEELELLTLREKEVLTLILERQKRRDIALALNVSENTIKKHTSHIFAKLEVSNREELFEKLKVQVKNDG